MRIKIMAAVVVTASLILIAVACTKKRDAIPVTTCNTTPGFTAEVSLIITTNCATNAACHASGSVNGPGPLTSYPQIKAAAEDIKNAVVSRVMPLGSSLSDSDIQTIKCWVEAGAPQN